MGLALGLLIGIRPNAFLFVVIPIFFLIVLRRSSITFRNQIIGSVLFLIAVSVAFTSVSYLGKKTFFYFPKNGGYNFFAGANEYSTTAFLTHSNAEFSLDSALKARGISSRYGIADSTYLKYGLNYILSHPMEYLKLTGLKFLVLFGPDYRQTQLKVNIITVKSFIQVAAKTFIALPFFFWLIILVLTRKKYGFSESDKFIIFIIILYIIPFIITNSDPRFRLPIDVIFILHAWRRISLFNWKNLFIKLNPVKG